MYMVTAPAINATTIEINIPEMMASAFPAFMYWVRSASVASVLAILKIDTATAAPSSSKTRETVVEVGRPNVL